MHFTDLDESFLETFESFDHHETVRKIVFANGVTAFIAVHNTALGPSLGGCRFKSYATERDAIHDVLRLSRGMTYKNALAGLPLGGGKAVIMADPKEHKTDDLMEEFGESVETLNGKYITAEDSGTNEGDMVAISEATGYVTGLPPDILAGKGFGELGGNPSPLTALGVYRGIQAAVKHHLGTSGLDGLRIAVQGVGAVGLELCKLLKQDGVTLLVSDIDEENLRAAKDCLGRIKVVDPEDIYKQDVGVFAPCAMGGVLNDETIPVLKAKIVAGAANNQLAAPYHDKMLLKHEVLYVPDYVTNAGGVICVGYEYFRRSGYNPLDFTINRNSMIAHVERIGFVVTKILEHAREYALNTGGAADKMAEAKFLDGESLDESNSESSSSFGQSGGMTLVQ